MDGGGLCPIALSVETPSSTRPSGFVVPCTVVLARDKRLRTTHSHGRKSSEIATLFFIPVIVLISPTSLLVPSLLAYARLMAFPPVWIHVSNIVRGASGMVPVPVALLDEPQDR